MIRVGTIAILAALSFGIAAPASATSSRHHHANANAETVTRQIERSCPPMCDNDTNPCDPLYFKLADGRCAPENRY